MYEQVYMSIWYTRGTDMRTCVAVWSWGLHWIPAAYTPPEHSSHSRGWLGSQHKSSPTSHCDKLPPGLPVLRQVPPILVNLPSCTHPGLWRGVASVTTFYHAHFICCEKNGLGKTLIMHTSWSEEEWPSTGILPLDTNFPLCNGCL